MHLALHKNRPNVQEIHTEFEAILLNFLLIPCGLEHITHVCIADLCRR